MESVWRDSARLPQFPQLQGEVSTDVLVIGGLAGLLTDQITGRENPYTALFSPSRSILHRQLAVNAAEATVGLLTPSRKRCPHLGCALKWNPQERSWDCPCHGSRFCEDGRLLDNPAAGDFPQK